MAPMINYVKYYGLPLCAYGAVRMSSYLLEPRVYPWWCIPLDLAAAILLVLVARWGRV